MMDDCTCESCREYEGKLDELEAKYEQLLHELEAYYAAKRAAREAKP